MSDRTRETGVVLSHENMNTDYRLLRLRARTIALRSMPGQFLFIKTGEGLEQLLRRPISICDVNCDSGEITMLYRVVGKGTDWLSRVPCGAELDLMGPIGTPFPEDCTKAILIAGGMGIAPLFLLAKRLHEAGVDVTTYYGAKSAAQLFLCKELSQYSTVRTAVEIDGQTVISLLPAQTEPSTRIYACGPVAMLATVQKWAQICGCKGYVSLEERMACGIGACSGCGFPMHGKNGNILYKKVCVDGPVFPIEEVVFNA